MDKASALSKDGRDSTVLEADEFRQLLNYSNLEGIPRLARENIKVNAIAGFIPIDMKSQKSNEQILNKVKNAQFAIDYVARKYKETPPKSSQEIYSEYALNHITDREILDKVDFIVLFIFNPQQHQLLLLIHQQPSLWYSKYLMLRHSHQIHQFALHKQLPAPRLKSPQVR